MMAPGINLYLNLYRAPRTCFASLLFACVQVPLLASPGFGQCEPVPCPGYDWVGVSPKNMVVPAAQQYVYCFQLIDPANCLPVQGFPAGQVELRFADCTQPSTRAMNEIPADGDSNANGEMFWVEGLAFGGSDPCEISVLIQNVYYYIMQGHPLGGLRSPDVDGDGLIALLDLLAWQMAFVSGNPFFVGDLGPQFDNLIALADLQTWQVHFTAP